MRRDEAKHCFAPTQDESYARVGRGVLRKSVQMKYAFIRDNQNLWSIDRLCSTLDVHHSGYYAWLKKPISKTARENQKLSVLAAV